jgi:hypothetical protein
VSQYALSYNVIILTEQFIYDSISLRVLQDPNQYSLSNLLSTSCSSSSSGSGSSSTNSSKNSGYMSEFEDDEEVDENPDRKRRKLIHHHNRSATTDIATINKSIEELGSLPVSITTAIMMLQEKIEEQSIHLKDRDQTIQQLQRELQKRTKIQSDEPMNTISRSFYYEREELSSTFYCSQRLTEMNDWSLYNFSRKQHMKLVTSRNATIEPISNINYTDDAQVDALAVSCKMDQILTACSVASNTFPRWHPYLIVSKQLTYSESRSNSNNNNSCSIENKILKMFQSSLGINDVWRPEIKIIVNRNNIYFSDKIVHTTYSDNEIAQMIKATDNLESQCSHLFELSFPSEYHTYPFFVGGIFNDNPSIIVGMFVTLLSSSNA